MDNYEKTLSKILSDSGTIGKLRQNVISLLLMIEEVDEFPEGHNNREEERAQRLVEKLLLLLNEFSTSQKIADNIFVNLSPEKRIVIRKEAPELFDIFGWHDKIDKNGNLTDNI